MSGSIIVSWPVALPDCPANWTEKPLPVLIRSEVQIGVSKSRRRYTRARLAAQPSFLIRRGKSNKLASESYLLFMAFFNATCLGGARPFYFVHPLSKVMKTWRWLEEPSISSYESVLIQIGCSWEEL